LTKPINVRCSSSLDVMRTSPLPNLKYLVPWNISVIIRPPPQCQSHVVVGGVGGRPVDGVGQDTSGQVYRPRHVVDDLLKPTSSLTVDTARFCRSFPPYSHAFKRHHVRWNALMRILLVLYTSKQSQLTGTGRHEGARLCSC